MPSANFLCESAGSDAGGILDVVFALSNVSCWFRFGYDVPKLLFASSKLCLKDCVNFCFLGNGSDAGSVGEDVFDFVSVIVWIS